MKGMKDFVSKCCKAEVVLFKQEGKTQYICCNCNKNCLIKPRTSKFPSDYNIGRSNENKGDKS